MADSILERIAQHVLTTVQSVTAVNGYVNTVTAERRLPRGDITDSPVRDSHCVVFQDEPALDVEAPQGRIGWWQPFWVHCYATEDEDSGTPLDARLNSLRADVEKALRVDPTRGGLAVDTDVRDPLFLGQEGGAEGVAVQIMVRYRTLEDDPYSQ